MKEMKKMKGVFLLAVVIGICGPVGGQITSGTNDLKAMEPKVDDMQEQNLDMATIRCSFHFTQKKKAGDKTAVRKDTLTLDIGPTMSRYYDEAKLIRDSLFGGIEKMSARNPSGTLTIRYARKPDYDMSSFMGDVSDFDFTDGTTEQVYKNRTENKVTVIDYEGSPKGIKYRCEDPVGALPWTITSDTATVLGYHCQHATLAFRGRSYNVWFAPEIPSNDGPWKFFGLPGLILRVQDTENIISMECVGIQYMDEPYSIIIPKGRYINCKRKELADMVRKRQSLTIGIRGEYVMVAPKPIDTSLKTLELK